MGHAADVCALQDFKKDYVYWYDAFIFHRPFYNRKLENMLSLMDRCRKLYLADYDDLIFDPENALHSPLYMTEQSSEKILLDIYKNNLKALKLFQFVTVSTAPLMEEAQRSHPDAKVELIHNGLSERWVKKGIDSEVSGAGRNGLKKKMIAYFPGTNSHNYDFKVVEDHLASYLAKRRNISLFIVGPLKFRKELFPEQRLITAEAVPYRELHSLIRSSWVSIAPLHDNKFNRCKSGLKFFESAAFGIPSVVSPIADMLRFDGSGIRFAHKHEDWSDAFDFFLDDESYLKISKQAQDYTLKNCMSMQQTERLLKFIENLCAERVSATEASCIDNKGKRHKDTYYDSSIQIFFRSKKDAIERKLRKLRRDPQRFFLDSRHKPLKVFEKLMKWR